MIFWKEWRVVKGRFLTLAAFYGITLLLLPIESIAIGEMFEVIPISLLSAGIALILIPVTLGMDAYVVEKDEETEDFLLSMPISWMKLLLAKVGLRTLLSFLLIVTLFAIILVRLGSRTEGLYLSTPPYTIWYVTLTVLIGHLIIVMVTSAVSVRAPFQSTSLIVGGSLGAVIAAVPVLKSSWQLLYLQAPWGTFFILLLLLVLSTLYTGVLFSRIETRRSPS